MNELVTKPIVVAIAATEINSEALLDWAEQNGLADVADSDGTPLNRIFRDMDDGVSHLDLLSEFSGRHCYRSWSKGRGLNDYFDNILGHGHGSVLEHSSITFAISGVSRSLTHELIRHRAGFSPSQESQRYVSADDINFVIPPLLLEMVDGDVNSSEVQDWYQRQLQALESYREDFNIYSDYLESVGVTGTMLKKRAAESARASLPNASETRLVWTGNMRAFRHLCELRGDEHADLEIRRLAVVLTETMMEEAPVTFRDFAIQSGTYGVDQVEAKMRKV